MGASKVNMRYEQFEIDVDAEEGSVFISQDNSNNDRADCVKLGLHQLPSFIAALQQAVEPVAKAD